MDNHTSPYLRIPQPPSKDEQHDAYELAKRLQDLELEETFFQPRNVVRFLRARNGNLDSAEKMIRNYLDWMKLERIDDFIQNYAPPSDLLRFAPWRVCAVEEDYGCPVVIGKCATWEPSDLKGRKDDLVKYFIYFMETRLRYFIQGPKSHESMPQIVVIADCKGLSWRHYTSVDGFQAGITALKIFESKYPEVLRACVMLNVPPVMALVWNIAKPFLHPRTQEKFAFIHSEDKLVWKEALMKYLPTDKFPEEYGGTLPDDAEIPVVLEKTICDESIS